MDQFGPGVLYYSVFVVEGISLFANSLVVYLALTETNKELLDYRGILVMNCLIDYTCTFVNMFNQAHIEFVDNLWIHVFKGPAKYLPRNLLYISVGSYSFMIAFGIMALPIQFVYRWNLIKNCHQMTKTEMAKIALIPFCCGVYFLCNFGTCFWYSDWKFADKSFLHNNTYIYNDLYPDAVVVIAELKSIPMLVEIIAASLCGLLIALLIWYFSYSVYSMLNKIKEQLQEKTRHLQKQMNIMLFIQTGAVFASAIIPLNIMLAMMIFNLNIPGMGTLINVFISFVPVINPMCTIFLVSRFRIRAVKLFCRNRKIQHLFSSEVTGIQNSGTLVI